MEEVLRRAWENILGRSDGPLHFRLILQPAMAIVFAIRAGLRDARDAKPPFLWEVFSNPAQRRELLRQAWKDVGTVFIVALVIDAIYQLIMHSSIYVLELLVTAALLAIVPYVLLRGLVTRLVRQLPRKET